MVEASTGNKDCFFCLKGKKPDQIKVGEYCSKLNGGKGCIHLIELPTIDSDKLKVSK